ncbi:BTB domain-containing protein [Mycena indigotica]|uniref:BTB domain-containing protein n=1 Tax=Mycena indigotica TaxID=2126181 RepID=A0A8H6S0P5_9AGAR|nr:BTB domain-containing protein [Mycena indigotica]KAF7291170.1 BTB domain-containing protein [Mycena indigotica]
MSMYLMISILHASSYAMAKSSIRGGKSSMSSDIGHHVPHAHVVRSHQRRMQIAAAASSSSTPTATTPTRVADLWFPEDNLIIRAEDRVFRVSKGVLAARSTVFKDMLAFDSVATDDDDDERIDGCPVVKLHDSAADVEVFLRAIFDSSFFEPPPTKTTLPTISGILRLSHKYDVQFLRRRALQHLDTGYPTSLAVYEISGTETFSSDGLDDSLLTIRVASEVGASWVLPTAFYFLCYSDMRDILNSPQWPLLSPVDQETTIVSYTKQRLACPPILPFLRIPFVEGCTSLKECDDYRVQNLANVHNWNISDPLGSYRDWTPFENLICAYCLKQAEEYHRQARRKLWDELPEIYGLPSWEELERAKAEALNVDEEMG